MSIISKAQKKTGQCFNFVFWIGSSSVPPQWGGFFYGLVSWFCFKSPTSEEITVLAQKELKYCWLLPPYYVQEGPNKQAGNTGRDYLLAVSWNPWFTWMTVSEHLLPHENNQIFHLSPRSIWIHFNIEPNCTVLMQTLQSQWHNIFWMKTLRVVLYFCSLSWVTSYFSSSPSQLSHITVIPF